MHVPETLRSTHTRLPIKERIESASRFRGPVSGEPNIALLKESGTRCCAEAIGGARKPESAMIVPLGDQSGCPDNPST